MISHVTIGRKTEQSWKSKVDSFIWTDDKVEHFSKSHNGVGKKRPKEKTMENTIWESCKADYFTSSDKKKTS